MEKEEKEFSQKSYLSLKKLEEDYLQEKKDRETRRALKVSRIFLIISISFSVLVLAISLCMKMVG